MQFPCGRELARERAQTPMCFRLAPVDGFLGPAAVDEAKNQNGDTEQLHQALQEQWEKEKAVIQEELSLLNKELVLSNEELHAAEED